MTLELRFEDIHSSDITERCLRKVWLKRQGCYEPVMPEAMYKGNLFNHAATRLAQLNSYDEDAVVEASGYATAKVQSDLKAENRRLSDAVEKNASRIHKELAQAVIEYARRFGERLAECRVIGVEIPIWWELPITFPPVHNTEGDAVEGVIEISSHLDLLMRDVHNVWGKGNRRLCDWDFKYHGDDASRDYLGRNQQMIAYQIAVARGLCLINGDWIHMDEWPATAWFHASSLRPYGKQTTTKNDRGEVQTFARGELRPEHTILRWIDFRPEREDDMTRELAMRAETMLAGFFPMNPDHVGCRLCECRHWCPRFDIANLQHEEP